MILRRHLHDAGIDVAHRMIRAVMAEPQATRFRTRGAADDLVTKADPEQRPAVVDDRARQRDRAVEPGGITGTWRQDHAVDIRGERLRCSCRMRQDADPGAAATEAADDVRLEPEIDDRHQRSACRGVADLRNAGR